MTSRSPLRTPPGRYGPQRPSRTERGRQWRARLREPGWVLLPLRAFLGVTFTFAALQKLADPHFFQAGHPTSIAAQMQAVRDTSPIGGLIGLTLHAPTAVGVLIAVAELGVGLGALAGLFTRAAAAVGMLLSLSFFLTISWHTRPYYYGSDIVFLFAWTPLLLVGAGGVLSADAWVARRARRDRGLPAAVEREDLPAEERALLDRRVLLRGGGAAAGLAAVGAVVGGLDAGVGRAAAHRSTGSAAGPSVAAPNGPPTAMPRAGGLQVGQALQFTDGGGNPAYLVRESATSYRAFSAVCTHAGCTVGYDRGSHRFVCPCHGGTYDARTGRVLDGPPPRPLRQYPVTVRNGQVFVSD